MLIHCKSNGRRIGTVAALIAGAFPILSAADTQPYRIPEVEVLGAPIGFQKKKLGTVYTIDAEAIARSGGRSLDEVITAVPGLNIRTGADGTPRIDIRGQRTRQVKLLVDGVPFNSSDDGQFDPTMIPAAMIERIEVISGGASILYGEGGTAGIINVVTRRGAGDAGGRVTLQAGTERERTGSAFVGGSRGAVDWSVGASHYEVDGFPLSNDFEPTSAQPGSLRVNSDRRVSSGYASLAFAPTADLQIGVALNASGGERGSPPSAIDDGGDAFAQRPRYERFEDIANIGFNVAMDWAVGEDTVARAWLYANQSEQTELRFDDADLALLQDPTIRGGFDLDKTSRVTGVHAQVDHAYGEHLSVGMAVDSRRETLDAEGRIRDVETASGGGGGGGG
ncbi:MAG: TonB-dependent receptor plug domain-containing protein, partial [Rhodocyclaceae bacterium]|nr:TonB-dependent receptor plug domain-containing protein [Rhodocyclaceae bacterium]